MARNVEIKAAVDDLNAVRREVQRVATGSPEIIEQVDTFFTVSAGRLKVRQFSNGSGELIAYHRPDEPGPKTSSYSIVTCPDARGLAAILSNVLRVTRRVTKKREVFHAGRTRIHLDEVEDLGSFVELEVVLQEGEPVGPAEQEARELMRRLGVSDEQLMSEAYVDLLERRATIRLD